MNAFVPVARSLFEPSARVVAPQLLGLWLIRQLPEGPVGGPIVETEAYLRDDPACHGAPGLTARNRAMFGPPGHAYVYLIYGFHHCVNTVCQPVDVAEAVLIRAVEPMLGLEQMQQRRSTDSLHSLTNGPGKLCAAMEIDRRLDSVDLCDPQSPLQIAQMPDQQTFLAERGPVVTATRIGITRAADLPLRFYLERSAFVSKRPARKPAKGGSGLHLRPFRLH